MYDMIRAVIYCSCGWIIILPFLTLLVSNDKVRYYIKVSYFLTTILATTTVLMPFMLLRPKDWRNAIPLSWCFKACAKIMGTTFLVRGKENIVKDSNSIVLINHQSGLDLCVLAELWELLGRSKYVVAKKEMLYYGPIGLSTWLVGTIFVSRRNREKDRDTMSSIVKLIKELNTSLIWFPEGCRHSNPTLIPFKKGSFHVAIDSQMPIQPVVVSKYYFYSTKSTRFDSGTSCITILPSISTKGLTKDNLPMLMADTYKIMNEVFHETSEEMLNKHINSLKDNQCE